MDFGKLTGAVLSLVVLAMVLGFGLLILDQTQTQIANISGNTSTAYTSVGTIITGIAGIPAWVPILVVVLMGSFILFLFFSGVFGGRNR